MLQFLALCSVLLFLLYKYLEKKFRYWEERGIASPPVTWPMGNLLERIRTTPMDNSLEWGRKYGKVFGFYNGLEPVLAVYDYKIAKKILIKDFQHFNTRVNFRTYHKMWNENLVFSGFESWKRVRTIASPAFTTGKLRSMHPLMEKCIEKLVVYFDSICDEKDGVFNTKETVSGFTMDVIASTAFGTDTNTNGMRQSVSPIVVNGMKLFLVPVLRTTAAFTFPRWLLRLLRIEHFLPTEPFNFFIDFTSHIIKQRKQNPDNRKDFIRFLLDAEIDEEKFNKTNINSLTASEDHHEETQEPEVVPVSGKKSTIQLTEDEIIAQAIMFLSAGFETTANTISHCMHELSLHPEIQETLFQEVKSVLGGQDSSTPEYYNKLMSETPYLEATIKETLRLYPVLSRLTRICNTEGYMLGDLKLENKQQVEIFLVSMHRDPEYFPEPEIFRPERFLTHNKDMAFLPFGNGPRNCIGMRFALQEMKACLAKLIVRYRFTVSNEESKVLNYRKATIFLNCFEFQTRITRRTAASGGVKQQ